MFRNTLLLKNKIVTRAFILSIYKYIYFLNHHSDVMFAITIGLCMKKINIYFGKKYYIGKELHGLTEAHSFFDEKRAFFQKEKCIKP